MPMKRVPIIKTLVLEFTGHITNAYTKSRVLNASKSATVTEADSHVATEVVVSPTPHTFNNIKKAFIATSMGVFFIDITHGGNTITGIRCDGMFAFYGAFDSISLYLETPTDPSVPTPKLSVACQYIS